MFHSYPSKRRPERLAEDGKFLREDSPRQIFVRSKFQLEIPVKEVLPPVKIKKRATSGEDIARSEVVRLARSAT